jgi:hypothetical protein
VGLIRVRVGLGDVCGPRAFRAPPLAAHAGVMDASVERGVAGSTRGTRCLDWLCGRRGESGGYSPHSSCLGRLRAPDRARTHSRHVVLRLDSATGYP